ncbi:MAG: SH3 domain-containing protein [Phormidesmis sp.]
MVMKNFLIGLSKFVLGIILAMLVVSLAGLSMARYFMTRMVEQPERPTYENDLPEDQRPADSPTSTEGADAVAPAPKTDAKPDSAATDPNAYKAYATSNLNLRSGPGTSYDSIGGVGIDESVTVLEEDSNWLKVQLSDGLEGWVSSSFVTKE